MGHSIGEHLGVSENRSHLTQDILISDEFPASKRNIASHLNMPSLHQNRSHNFAFFTAIRIKDQSFLNSHSKVANLELYMVFKIRIFYFIFYLFSLISHMH